MDKGPLFPFTCSREYRAVCGFVPEAFYGAVALLSYIPPTFLIDSEGPGEVFDKFYSYCFHIISLFYIVQDLHERFQMVAGAWHRVGAKHLVNE